MSTFCGKSSYKGRKNNKIVDVEAMRNGQLGRQSGDNGEGGCDQQKPRDDVDGWPMFADIDRSHGRCCNHSQRRQRQEVRGKKWQSRKIIVELKIVKDYLTHIERMKSFYVEDVKSQEWRFGWLYGLFPHLDIARKPLKEINARIVWYRKQG